MSAPSNLVSTGNRDNLAKTFVLLEESGPPPGLEECSTTFMGKEFFLDTSDIEHIFIFRFEDVFQRIPVAKFSLLDN